MLSILWRSSEFLICQNCKALGVWDTSVCLKTRWFTGSVKKTVFVFRVCPLEIFSSKHQDHSQVHRLCCPFPLQSTTSKNIAALYFNSSAKLRHRRHRGNIGLELFCHQSGIAAEIMLSFVYSSRTVAKDIGCTKRSKMLWDLKTINQFTVISTVTSCLYSYNFIHSSKGVAKYIRKSLQRTYDSGSVLPSSKWPTSFNHRSSSCK